MKNAHHAVCRTLPCLKQRGAALCLALSAGLASWPSLAQQPFDHGRDARAGDALLALPLDALLDMEVTGPSRYAQRASESAAAVTVITAPEIRALGFRTLGELLQTVRGLNVSDDRVYANLGVRGFSTPGNFTSRVLVLINGNRVNDPVYGQAYIGGEFPLDMDLIERVEFIPGQGSAVYGGNALFGVVNVITRNTAIDEARWVSLYGSGRLREARLGFSRGMGEQARLTVSASRRLSDGVEVMSPDAKDLAGGVDYERRSHLLMQGEQGPLAVTLIASDRFKGIPSALGLAFGDPASRNRDRHMLLDATLNRAMDSDSQWTTRLYGGRYTFEGQYRYEQPETPLNVDRTEARWAGLESRWFTTRWAGHKWLLGTEWTRSWRLQQANFDVEGARTVYFDANRGETRMAVYAEDQMEISPRWTLSGGARYDWTADRLQRISPRLALNFRPGPASVFKLIHATAVREPNAFEALYESDSVGGFIVNRDLREEVERGTEAAFEWQLDPTSRMAGSVFVNRTKHLLSLRYSSEEDRFSYVNAQPMESRGLELEFERVWRSGARLRANLSLQRTHESAAYPLAGYFPKRMAKLSAMLPLADDWMLGVSARAVSRRNQAAGYGTVDAHVSRYLGHQGSMVSLGLYNLTDRRHEDPGADAEFEPVRLRDRLTFRLRWELAL